MLPSLNRRPIQLGLSIVASIVVLFFMWVLWWPNPVTSAQGTVVSIPRGSTFRAAIDSLDAAGAIRSRWAIRLVGRVLGYDRHIRVGRYLFRPGLSNLSILEDLSNGSSRVLVSVPLPEGWRMGFIAKRFERLLGVDSSRFMHYCRDSAFIRSLGVHAPTLEGYLLPDTYDFYWQTDEEELVKTLVSAFQLFYSDSLIKRQRQLGWSLNQVLALASIVEGEAHIDSERAVIAGVYWNRLKKGMRLEADPTIQYILPDGPRRLTYADLRVGSSYNTYLYSGLPPGPINSPGRLSILATLFPVNHTYLFFVATGYGGHHFTSSYGEHQRAVRSFRRTRRLLQQSASPSAR